MRETLLNRRRFLAYATGATSLAGIGMLTACGASGTAATSATTSSTAVSTHTSATSSKAASSVTVASVSSSTTASPTAKTAPPTSAKKVTVTGWVPFGGLSWQTIQKMGTEFNKQSDTIHLELQSIQVPGAPVPYSGKIQPAIASGTPPEFAVDFDEAAIQLASSGALEPVDAMLGRLKLAETDFSPAAIAGMKYQGHLWGFPIDWDPDWMLYYNEDLFKSKGIKSPPSTLEDLTAMAPEFDVKQNGKITRLGYLPWIGWGFYPIAYAFLYGGVGVDTKSGKPNLDSPHVIEGMNQVYEFAKKYPATQIASFTSGFTTLKAGPFPVGQVAMMAVGDWMIPSFEQYAPHLNYSIVPFPVPAAHQSDYHYSSSGWLYMVFKGAKEKSAAATVLDWFLQDTQLTQWCRGIGWLPAKLSAQRNYGSWDPHWKQVIDVATKYQSRLYPEIWPSKQSLAVESAMKSAAGLVIDLKATPQQAFAAAQKRVLSGL